MTWSYRWRLWRWNIETWMVRHGWRKTVTDCKLSWGSIIKNAGHVHTTDIRKILTCEDV